jgi:hypothetical protein
MISQQCHFISDLLNITDSDPDLLVVLIPMSFSESRLYYVAAGAYCSWGCAWELAEDPIPRLALFLVYQQTLLV